ncbi:PAS domain-containing sensor histidine kinase [Photobacterium atrarenae]|uniref:histidine kinase n=1 Tax=Photobacterium atrarenae TaxID=865757 RepID=A0ABY5GN20_9GAMM|nr:ATP-binding protein [Photobacterium atrarenae]UTV30632.1 ATP-binding protein [Photobacterium atrarenae]
MMLSRRIKMWLAALAVVLLMAAGIKATRELCRQWLLETAQSAGEDRLLSYVGDIRRALQRYHYLPYLVAEHQDSRRLLAGEQQVQAQVEPYLAQLDKAANTKGWYILTAQGELVAASQQPDNWVADDGRLIADKLRQQGGDVVTLSKMVDGQARYFLAAPVYTPAGIIGIAVVKVGLSTLTESWLAENELVLISDPGHTFFLSSSHRFSAAWLNEQAKSWSNDPIQAIRLYSGTELATWQLGQAPYLVQTVELDDLRWKLYYLTPLTELNKAVAWVGTSAAIVLLSLLALGLFVVERRQKLRSKQQLQQLVAESEARLRRMFSKTHVGLMLVDSRGKISEINPTAMRYFSLSPSMIHHIVAWQLFETHTGNSTVMLLLKNLTKQQEWGEISGVEAMAQRSDGSRFPVLFSLSALPWYGEKQSLITVIDISKRKKAENALRAANESLELRVQERTEALQAAQAELVQSSKMAALGRMSSAITHELNQPLTGLKTLLSSNELLIERGETQLLMANTKLVNTLLDRMASMTSQLKTFAFNRPEQLQPTSLPDVLQQVLRIHQHRLENVQVRIRVPAQLPAVLGEPQRLMQVLGNLISNALDAMTGTTSPSLVVAATEQDEQVVIQVTDNGTGISEAKLGSIFEPFQTSKKMGEGLGLGLSITANSVRDMQGSIIAANNIDDQGARSPGMTFTVVLQRALAADLERAPVDQLVEAETGPARPLD